MHYMWVQSEPICLTEHLAQFRRLPAECLKTAANLFAQYLIIQVSQTIGEIP